MAVPPHQIVSVQMVAQENGIRTPLTPAPPPARPNATENWDVFSADIGNLWDAGDGRILIGFGDSIGSDLDGRVGDVDAFGNVIGASFFTSANALHNTDNATPIPVAGWVDGQGIAMQGVAGFDPKGYVSIQTGAGPGGLAVFNYDNSNPTGDPVLLNVDYVCGGGTFLPGANVYAGDPRTGFRGSLLAVSTTTDIRNGYTIDSFYTNPSPGALQAGVAWEPWPFPIAPSDPGYRYGAGRTAQARVDVWPRIGASTTIRTGGIAVTNAAFTAGTGVIDAAVPPAVSTEAFASGKANSPANRITVATSTGTALFSYADKVVGAFPQFTGCTRISGTGTLTAGGAITQTTALGDYVPLTRVDNAGYFTTFTTASPHGLEMGRARPGGPFVYIGGYAGPLAGIDAYDFTIWDVPTTTTFRVLTYGADGGGTTSAFAFFPYNTFAGVPLTAPRDGNICWGGCSATRAGSLNGKRQIAFTQGTLYHGPYPVSSSIPIVTCDMWISDDGGAVWSIAASWENNQHFDSAVMGITPYRHTDGYVYSICTPGVILARCLETDLAKPPPTKADWRYWNGSAWSATIPSSATAKLWTEPTTYLPEAASNAIALWYSTHFGIWVATYTQGFDTYARFAYTLTGPWSAQHRMYGDGDFGPNQSFVYGAWPHPYSGTGVQAALPGSPTEALMLSFNLFGSYQIYLAKVVIADPGAANTMAEERHCETQYKGPAAKLINPPIESPTIKNWDDWIGDKNTWTRTGANTFSVLGVDATSYLKPYVKVSVFDGIAIRYAHILTAILTGPDTLVTLIPHNDGAGAGAILSIGSLSAPRYTAADAPGWPGTFVWPCVPTGFSVVPSGGIYRYVIRSGNKMRLDIREANTGTSNNAAHTYPLPAGVVAKTRTNDAAYGRCGITDAGIAGGLTQDGRLRVLSGGTAIQAFTSILEVGWTASGATRVLYGDIEVELA